MEEIPSRHLRNHTAEALQRVQSGTSLVVTVHGRPAARLVPLVERRREWISRRDLVARLQTSQADSGLRADLTRLVGDTTDDLGTHANAG